MVDPYRVALQYSEVGAMLHKTGDHQCALEQYRECLSIQQRLLGKDHHETATTHFNIGVLLANMGDCEDNYDTACVELQKCYEIRKQTFGRQHKDTLECLESIDAVMELALNKRERNLFHEKNKGERPILIHSSSFYHGGSSSRSHGKTITKSTTTTHHHQTGGSTSAWNNTRNSRHQRSSVH